MLASPFPANKSVIRTCLDVFLLHVHQICTRGKQQSYLQRHLEEVLSITKPSQYEELSTMTFRDPSLPPPNSQGKQLQMVFLFLKAWCSCYYTMISLSFTLEVIKEESSNLDLGLNRGNCCIRATPQSHVVKALLNCKCNQQHPGQVSGAPKTTWTQVLSDLEMQRRWCEFKPPSLQVWV